MVKVTRHDNKSYKYANEWFDRPHDWNKDLGDEPLPKGMAWPGFKQKLSPPQDPGKGLIPQMRKRTAPIEQRRRPRRKSQEI